MTSAREREGLLQPALDAARQRIRELTTRTAAAETRARDGYTSGDVSGGHAAVAEAAGLRAEADAEETRLEVLGEAARVLSAERNREALAARLAAAETAMRQAAETAEMHRLTVEPAIVAAKAALRQALALEAEARKLDGQRHRLRCELDGSMAQEGGMVRIPPYTSPYRKAANMVEAKRFLSDLMIHLDY